MNQAKYSGGDVIPVGDLVSASVPDFRDNGPARVTGVVKSVSGEAVEIDVMYAVFAQRRFVLGLDAKAGTTLVPASDVVFVDGLGD